MYSETAKITYMYLIQALPKVDLGNCSEAGLLNKNNRQITNIYRVLHTNCMLTDTVAIVNF